MKRRAALGAVAVLTLGGAACGIPTGGGPTAIPKSNVPYHLLAPATTTTSSATPRRSVCPSPSSWWPPPVTSWPSPATSRFRPR